VDKLKKLGKLIKAWRVVNDKTQGQLADELGVSRGTISSWEIGAKEPSATRFVKLVLLMNIPWEEIYEVLGFEKEIENSTESRLYRVESALRQQGILR